ncbi:MAG: IPT/TIG domain-containing protein [Prevotellaceae bacterium]|jgi:hypothetical protein|nr:IPT/TIG domain-containing protein [Prevotellaceae bacterium]
MRKLHICWIIAFSFALNACKEEPTINKNEILPPVLIDFSPKSGETGTEITITGENLHRIDSVMLGTGFAELKYKINENKIIAVVTSASRSGKLVVANVKGRSVSADDFTVVYVQPSVAEYPVEGTINADVGLEGENLHVVDSVMLAGAKTTIISKRKNEIVFRVPFIDTKEPVSLRLFYFNGETNAAAGPEGNTFTILQEAPFAEIIPVSLEKYTPVTITGERLTLIDSLFVGNLKMRILSKNDDELTFDLPTNYFDGAKTDVLRGIYYGIKEIILEENFHINSDVNEKRYYQWDNVLLSARVPNNSNGTEDAFFDAETGIVHHSCTAHDNRMDIDFFAYDQIGYVQLYGPHNATSVTKNFKCDNKSIVSEDLNWNDFYGITTKFKILSRDSVNHLPLINAYESGTIIEINDELFDGILLPGASAPRVYKSVSVSGFQAGSHIAVDGDNLAWVRNYTTGKNGIIKILDLPREAHTNGRIADITFTVIWEK